MPIFRRVFSSRAKAGAQIAPAAPIPAETIADAPAVEPTEAAPESTEAHSVIPPWSEPCLAGFVKAEPRLGVALEAGRRRNMVEKATDGWERILASGYRANKAILEPRPKAVVVMGWLKRGGAEYVGARILKEAQGVFGADEVLLILTDRDVVETPDWLDPRTRIFNLPRQAHWLSRQEQAALVQDYLLSVAPRTIINCNSELLWDLWRENARSFADSSRLYGFIFCYEYSATGNILGYAVSHLNYCIDELSGILTDNGWFFSELRQSLGYPQRWEGKFQTLYQPVEAPGYQPPGAQVRAPGERPKVLWASRICAQKRPDLLLEIARLCPEFDFHVHGDFYNYGPTQYDEAFFSGVGNVTYGGVLGMLQDLPTQDYCAFLYTAAYDGLPNILLAAGAVGLPIVASHVGGIGDLVDNERGWLIEAVDDAQAYATALHQVVEDPERASGKAASMLNLIRTRHSEAVYRERIFNLGLFNGA